MSRSLLIITILFCSCVDSKPNIGYDESRMDSTSKELNKFEEQLILLYQQSDTNANKVMAISKRLADSIKKAPDPYNISYNKLSELYQLRAELMYKSGHYENSIEEIRQEIVATCEWLDSKNPVVGDEEHLFLACNYVGMKKFELAKRHLDSVHEDYYIYKFVLGNFYESIGELKNAIGVYEKIVSDKTIAHYTYYNLAKNRLIELGKTHPVVLNKLYYPTSNPSIEL